MRHVHHARLLPLLLVALVALGHLARPPVAAAQSDDVISATVDRTTLTTDDLLTLNVTIDRAAGASEPVLPALDGFNLLGTSSGTEISILNGDMNIRLAYTYYLQPTQAGDLVIPPFTTSANGQTYQSDPILITVAQGTGQFQPSVPVPGLPNLPGVVPPGSGQPPPANGGTLPAPPGLTGQEYYVEASVDKANPWQGEQVLYRFRFFQGASLLVEPNYQPPEFTGFWHDRQAEQTTYTTEAAGRTYFVTEITTVLFPTVSGPITIGPSTLEIPGGFFATGQTLTTEPIALDVRPLPANPPPGFTGAVGQFSLQSLLDKTTSQVNDAVTLQVTLSGVGNIDTLADLSWDVGPGWRGFDPTVESASDFVNGQLQGSRIYEQLLVPVEAGSLTVEPIAFTYFDPVVGDYQTITTQPIVVQVSADPSSAGLALPASNVPAGIDITSLRPVKGPPASWRVVPAGAAPHALVTRPGYWALFAVPLLLLAGLGLYGGVTAHRRATAGDRAKSRAAREATHALAEARRAAEKAPGEAAAAGARIMNSYLSTKLDAPTTGLTRQGLGALLRSRGLDEALIDRVQGCLADSDTAAYFPGSSAASAAAILDEVEATVRALEAALEERGASGERIATT
jgi:hypothetical protein